MNARGSSHSHSASRSYLPSLDGLRALAILLVLLCHVQTTRGFPDVPRLKWILGTGVVGVDLFFVISGFLITTLLLRELRRTERVDLKGFYVRRFLRIVPAYVSLLAVLACMQLGGQIHFQTHDWLTAATYTANFVPERAKEIGHAWSLSVEEHFYLLWPALIVFAGVRASRRVAVACILLCPVLRGLIFLFFPPYVGQAGAWTFTRMDSIATGCLLALLVGEKAWKQRLNRLVENNWFVLLAFLGFAASLVLSIRSRKYDVVLSYSVNALCLGVLTWAAIHRADSRIGRLLNGRLLRIIGVGSYSLYLWQQLFLYRYGDDIFCAFPQNLLFAFLAAPLSYFLIERPFLLLKDRLSLRRAARIPVAAESDTVSSPTPDTGASVAASEAAAAPQKQEREIRWTETVPLPGRL